MDHRGAPTRSLAVLVLVVGGALAGCGDDAASYGPLAVQRPLEGSGDARNEGTLVVTDTCVHLRDARGLLVTLVWEADRVSLGPGHADGLLPRPQSWRPAPRRRRHDRRRRVR